MALMENMQYIQAKWNKNLFIIIWKKKSAFLYCAHMWISMLLSSMFDEAWFLVLFFMYTLKLDNQLTQMLVVCCEDEYDTVSRTSSPTQLQYSKM